MGDTRFKLGTACRQCEQDDCSCDLSVDELLEDHLEFWREIRRLEGIEDAQAATIAAAQQGIKELRWLLREIIARHDETRDEILNDDWGTEFDINGVLDVIDHMCVWSDIRLARIDAKLREVGCE